MSKKLTIEVSDDVHKQLTNIQDKKKGELKAKVPLAVIAAEVLEETLVKKGKGK